MVATLLGVAALAGSALASPPVGSRAFDATAAMRRQLQIDDRINTDVMADDSCAITLVFGQLMAIKSDANCQVSCDGGVCGDDWYPGTDDTCNAECGLVFEPFWDACGHMLQSVNMGGMEEMGMFYDNCLENLYPPGSCGFQCNQHTYDCYVGEIQESCCDEGGANCPATQDVPTECAVGCAIVFPEFWHTCQDHVAQSANMNEADFAAFEEQCFDQDGIALVEYALNLQDGGCIIDLTGGEGGRRLQNSYLTQYLGTTESECRWDDLDEKAREIDTICCGRDGSLCAVSNGVFGSPRSCSAPCALAMHDFWGDCGSTLQTILGADRSHNIDDFRQQCLDEADPDFFIDAIMHADCTAAPDLKGR